MQVGDIIKAYVIENPKTQGIVLSHSLKEKDIPGKWTTKCENYVLYFTRNNDLEEGATLELTLKREDVIIPLQFTYNMLKNGAEIMIPPCLKGGDNISAIFTEGESETKGLEYTLKEDEIPDKVEWKVKCEDHVLTLQKDEELVLTSLKNEESEQIEIAMSVIRNGKTIDDIKMEPVIDGNKITANVPKEGKVDDIIRTLIKEKTSSKSNIAESYKTVLDYKLKQEDIPVESEWTAEYVHGWSVRYKKNKPLEEGTTAEIKLIQNGEELETEEIPYYNEDNLLTILPSISEKGDTVRAYINEGKEEPTIVDYVISQSDFLPPREILLNVYFDKKEAVVRFTQNTDLRKNYEVRELSITRNGEPLDIKLSTDRYAVNGLMLITPEEFTYKAGDIVHIALYENLKHLITADYTITEQDIPTEPKWTISAPNHVVSFTRNLDFEEGATAEVELYRNNKKIRNIDPVVSENSINVIVPDGGAASAGDIVKAILHEGEQATYELEYTLQEHNIPR